MKNSRGVIRRMNEIINNEVLHKEIDLIQSCISRMENNSLMLKGWFLTLILAFIALVPENINRHYICIIILLIDLVFWYLNAFYLKLERLYRWKYEWVINKRLEGNRDFIYNLDPYEKNMWINKKESNIVNVMFTSYSLLVIYGGIFLSVIFLIIFKYH